MTSALIPDDDAQRLAVLRRYDILDTPPDGAFDRITALVARELRVPIAIVSLVDHDRVWFKSHHGVDTDRVGRDPGLCASAILQDGPWQVSDAAADPRTLANPLVTGPLGLRFYLGIPLKTHDGYNLGTLCAIAADPREATENEILLMRDLAGAVMDQMELRLAARRVVALEEEARQRAEDQARSARRLAETLEAGLETNRQIGKAMGLVMAQYKVDDRDAFDKLRQASQDLNTKLNTIAEELITHHNSGARRNEVVPPPKSG